MVSAIIDYLAAVAIADGVSDQNKEDFANSILLGLLASEKQYSPQNQFQEFLGVFTRTVEQIGWIVTNVTTDRIKIKDSTSASDLVIGLIDQKDLVTKTVTALLDQKNKAVLSQFDKFTTSYNSATFQVGVVSGSDGSVLSYNVAIANYSTESSISGVLSTKLGSSDRFEISRLSLELNLQVYAPMREIVKEKLGDNIRTCIVDIKL